MTKLSALPKPTEKEVQRAIKQLATDLGFFVTDFSQPRRTMQTRGIPDLYLTQASKQFRVWVECKAPGRKRSMDQLLWHAAVQPAGAHVWTCDSVQAFAAKLNEHGFVSLPTPRTQG